MNRDVTLHPLSVLTQRNRLWLALFVFEGLLLVGYFELTLTKPTGELRYLIYPFIWINAAVWAVLNTEPNPGSWGHRVGAAAVGLTYLLVLLYIPGNIGLGSAGLPVDLRIEMYAPGWGPLIAFTSPWLRAFLVPFEVIGYAALAYLMYANTLELTRGALSGALGLVTCVGCTVPLVAPVVGVLGGPAASLTTTAYAWSYDIGTAIFVVTVYLLYWSHRRYRT